MEMLEEQKQCAISEVDSDRESINSEDNFYLPAAVENGHEKVNRYLNHSSETELFKFLIQKDLLISRLTNFNDRIEMYIVWKIGFQNVMKDLNINSEQEVDPLIKWLGPLSRTYAIRIRAANIDNSEQALKNIWSRLGERYGAPELVESTLKRRLMTFQKIKKDHKKLYDLSDLLSEIVATKQNKKYSTVLAQFDSASGVNPIIQKLPYSLQRKWTDQA